MLQSIAAWLLRTYLGEYIENLNTDQLSVGYGGIELANLYLKKSALDQLQLPVKLISGVIGQLNLVIPYANPNTQPWVIKINRLCIIVEGNSKLPNKVTPEELEELKRQKLQKLEAEWKANMERSVKGGWWSGSWMPSLYSSISTSIVENLVLEVNDVHIRYQYSTKPNLSFGIKIDSLASKSARKNLEEVTNDIKLKLVELKDLSIYFDRKNVMKDVLQKDLQGLENILGPVSATAQIQRNVSKIGLTSKDGPRFRIDVMFEEIALALSQCEYTTFFEVADKFNRYFKAMDYHALRPKIPLHKNAKVWWRYAIQAVVQPIKEKNSHLSKAFLLTRLKDITDYVKLYMLSLTNVSSETDVKNKTCIEKIEAKLKLEEVIILRKIVYAKIVEDKNAKKKAEAQVVAANSNKSWSSWAMGFYYGKEEESDDQLMKAAKVPKQDEMTKEERQFLDELSETIDQEEGSMFKKDSIFAHFCFLLKSGSLLLKDEKEQKILDVGFERLNLVNEARPKSRTFEWNVSLGKMLVKNLNEKDKTFSALVSPQIQEGIRIEEDHKFITVKFSQQQLQAKSIYSLMVNLQPSTIVYQPKVLQKITNFFIIPTKSKYNIKSSGMSEKLQETFHSRFEELKRATQNEIASATISINKERGQQDEWNIDLDIAAPNFIIPIQASNTDGTDKLVSLNFGRIAFINEYGRKKDHKDSEKIEEDEDDDEFLTPSSTPPSENESESMQQVIDTSLPQDVIREKFYDSYTLELTKLQVLVCNASDNWMALQLKGFGQHHIIEQFSVSLTLKRRTLFTADPEFPALILTGVLPQLFVHIDEKKLETMNSCMTLFSSPNSAESFVQPLSAKSSLTLSNVDSITPKDFHDLLIESKLIEAKFTFEKLSLALHSRGRCFAELQIDGVGCEFSKRPYDMSVSLIISSLRLVDAIQIFGADYELLVSSRSNHKGGVGSNEVLMHVSYQKIDSNCPMLGNPENSPLQVVSVNVNALHINGNLETIVELNNIVNQMVSKQEKRPSYKDYHSRLSESMEEDSQLKTQPGDESRMEISGCFNQIDILILRTEIKEFTKTPLHVAHVSAKQFEVNISLNKTKVMEGSIGTILIKDVSPSSLFYKNILSIGTDIKVSSPVKMEEEHILKAFRFTYKDKITSDNVKNLNIRMASLYYFHNPNFIKEISLCAGDYKQYAYNLAKSLQSAAADMAKSMVLSQLKESTFTSSSVKNDNAKQGMMYSVFVETPVVVFPKNSSSKNLIVGYLGKISATNETLLQPKENSTVAVAVDRILVEVDDVNLSLINIINSHDTIHESMHEMLQLNQNNQTSVLHNTNLLLTFDKRLPNTAYSQIKPSFELNGCINAPLKLFLSVPVYQQLLSTVSYATKINDDSVASTATSPTITPSTSLSHVSMATESTWDSSHTVIGDMEDVMFDTHETDEKKLSASFNIPSVQIELHGELHGKPQGFVIVRFDGFDLKYSNSQNLFSTVNISLQSFSIEDLLHANQDKYRYLVSSVCDTSVYKNMLNRTCSSCPEEIDLYSQHGLSKSLPNIFHDTYKNSFESSDSVELLDTIMETAVGPLINVEIIFAKNQVYNNEEELYEEAKNNILVDINSVDFVINLQTWVILFEFFGIGGQANPNSPAKQQVNTTLDITQDTDSISTNQASSETELQVSMKSVSFYLNKEDYPLAKASIDAMNVHVLLNDGNQDVSGSIGNINLYDLSPHAGFYQQRLITVGDKAVDFSFFRFGKPDPDLKRDLDMELTLSMSALQYVHTQRFLMEIISFCQHFLLLQEVLGRMRAASAGDEVMSVINRAGRLLLKVNADAPILLLPHKATSRDLFVVNLGKLDIHNEFVYSSNPKTNGYGFIASRYRSNGASPDGENKNELKCDRLLDCISIKLSDMQIFSALKVDSKPSEGMKQKIKYEEQGNKMMQEPCLLELTLERNLEWMFGRQVPDMSIYGVLTSVFVNLDLSQFSLIMGMLGENLGEPLDAFDAPSTVLVDPLVLASPTKQVWTGMRINLNLLNVSIIISPTFSFGPIQSKPYACQKLARCDLKNSKLIYESFSDGSKSVDLVSSDVLIHDIRNNDEVDILLPVARNKTDKNYLQFEVHYLDTQTKSFITFLCNQSRIILLFDFLLECWRFLSRTEENEYKAATSPLNESTTSMEDFEPIHSSSVVTKTSQLKPSQPPKKMFEMKVNITESELIMVEDIKHADTQTVILKLTAVLAYRPDHMSERPVNCSIQNLEIFSCLLNQPDSSALSILDPVAFLIELKSPKAAVSSSSIGLQDAIKPKPILETQFQAPVSMRVSYHDVQMFLHILNKSKEQIATAVSKHKDGVKTNLNTSLSGGVPSSLNISTSKELSTAPIKKAITAEQSSSSSIGGFEMKGNLISLVLIDDSGNNDVPLMELQFSNLLLHHAFDHEWKGIAKCHIDANYYNTRVSAWEPFIEAWKFNIHWFNIIESNEADKLVFKVDAPERLDMNITCAFIGIVQQTVADWSTRFMKDAYSKEKKRAPFLPFLLRNKTGCKLTFYTTQRSPTHRSVSRSKHSQEFSINEILDVRYEVANDDEVKFSFEKRTKNRHQVSHQLTVHQIVVQVGDWQRMTPLTVDRVEQFFRIAYPTNQQKEGDEVFVIFDISLEGARKVITVKSAFSITNALDLPMEVMAQLHDKHYSLTVLSPNQSYSLPLKMVRSRIFCRPLQNNTKYEYSTEPLNWKEVVTSQGKGFIMTCKSTGSNPASLFRFCSVISYLGLPKGLNEGPHILNQPEHSITLINHVVLENTLPVDLFYFIRGSLTKEIVRPGQSLPLFMHDPYQPIEIGFSFESFPTFDMIKIVLDENNYILPARVYDLQNRILILKVYVTFKCGAVNISVFAPFWLINKTSLPLIFKREEENEEISGQFDEHEEARTRTPLLFSFISSENPYQCLMRVGGKHKRSETLQPLWSKPFAFDKESEYRTLYVKGANNRLERSYDVGLSINWGKGVFNKTKIVSFVPRFQFDNQTKYKLCVTQRHLLVDATNLSNDSVTTCYPGTVSFYHWYRADYDQILCVRNLDDTGSLWSGGIRIDRETSFHLNIKSNSKKSPETFLRAHVSYNAGTYRCTFSDASLFPPPFRILNLSEVSLFYWQEAIGESQMNSFIKGKEMKNYVLDEPILPAKLTLSVFNESSQTYDLCANIHHGDKLYYQNAIFIAFTHTFYGTSCNKHTSDENTTHELVLDVKNERDIILGRKVQHKRSQLWRMNAEGNLVHFGSSSMKGSRKSSFTSSSYLVLDVQERKEKGVLTRYLVLNEKNAQREQTQTWYFESNMLRCCLPGLVIHCPSELKEESLVTLGPKPSSQENNMFFHSCVSRQKMRPGSGVLSVRVYSQGPTHVIEISDSQQEPSPQSWVMLNNSQSNILLATLTDQQSKKSSTEVVLSLAGGIGISFINLKPEELFFATLSQIKFKSLFNKTFQNIDLEIGAIQIDNQLFGCELPVSVFSPPQVKKSFSPPQVKKSMVNSSNLLLSIHVEKDEDFDLLVFKECSIDVCKLNMELEDRLLLKLIQAIQNLLTHDDVSVKKSDEPINIFDSHHIDNKPTVDVKDKLFFESLVVNQGELRISLLTTGKIDQDLMITKKNLGIPFISFEDAAISFDQYNRHNVLETKGDMLNNILQFYKETFKNQAAVLLGSLDILGNPMGFIQDFSSGVEGLLKKGNIGGLFVNVAHGFSDSAAKMTGVIADGLWSASMDSKFQESRDSLRVSRASSSSSHFSAGLKGFGMGMIGGLTSMVTQPIEGASKKGVTGFFAGIGKGLVGTVAKPVAGVLDFASGTAAAVRMSTETQLPTPKPVRLKRNCYGPGGVLGKYIKHASEGQEILLKFNEGDVEEMYVAMEVVRPSTDRLKAILTNKGIYFVKSGPPCPENIKLHVEYTRLLDSQYYFEESLHFIEMFLCRRQDYSVQEYNLDNRTTVRCETERVAYKVTQKANYLKSLYEESLFAVPKVVK